MAHANAALTPKHRLRLARLIVEDGWPPSRAAEFFNVSWRTASKWAQRYRDEGPGGMADRTSARHTQHAKTPQPVVRKIVQKTPAEQPWQAGSTSTTTTGPTQPSVANHPSIGWTTWLDITVNP
ncbi:hypothetical protein GCM10028772_39330 [Nocardioides ultimimeridianus]